MNDDWRLLVLPRDPHHGHVLVEAIQAKELEHELSVEFEDRVVVSREGSEIFFYAGAREQLERVRDLVVDLGERHGWHLDIELARWHPGAEEWQDPDKPLPHEGGEGAAEHEELMRTEDREAERRGYPEFEVRVDLGSHREAARLAKQLRSEGIPNVHRWRFVLVGASDEDVAKELAERVQAEAPAGSKVAVEGSWRTAWEERPPSPFAFMGGLAS